MKYYNGVLLEGIIAGGIGGFLYWLINAFTLETVLAVPMGGVYGGVMGLFIGLIIKPNKNKKW